MLRIFLQLLETFLPVNRMLHTFCAFWKEKLSSETIFGRHEFVLGCGERLGGHRGAARVERSERLREEQDGLHPAARRLRREPLRNRKVCVQLLWCSCVNFQNCMRGLF